MGRMNSSYGSELHLLRMLGRHRSSFSQRVCGATGAHRVEWIDFPSGKMKKEGDGHVLWDKEWQQLEFLSEDHPASLDWKNSWPTHRTGQNWDALGRLFFRDHEEWLLVEAKANVQELKSACQASDPASRSQIEKTLNATKSALGVSADCEWTKPYYQYCNRLAVLNVMNTRATYARLLHVYFCGDISGNGRDCPESEAGWTEALLEQDRRIGLPDIHPLSGRIHKLFLNVQVTDDIRGQ